MNYAIIRTGGKQYRVKANDELNIEKLDNKENEEVIFDEVLAYKNGDELEIGTPLIDGAKVIAEVLEQGLAEPVIIFKYKPKKGYRRKNEHRQPYTTVKIKDILVGDESIVDFSKLEETNQEEEPVEETVSEVETTEVEENEVDEPKVIVKEDITIEEVVTDDGDVVIEEIDEITEEEIDD